MTKIGVPQMAERVSELLHRKYRMRGDLATQTQRLRRRLPSALREALAVLVAASHMSANPRLAPQIDMQAVVGAYDLALRHLNATARAERRKTLALGILASIAFSLLVVAALLGAVLHWRGFL